MSDREGICLYGLGWGYYTGRMEFSESTVWEWGV